MFAICSQIWVDSLGLALMHNIRVEAIKEHTRLYLVTSAKSDYKEHVPIR